MPPGSKNLSCSGSSNMITVFFLLELDEDVRVVGVRVVLDAFLGHDHGEVVVGAEELGELVCPGHGEGGSMF